MKLLISNWSYSSPERDPSLRKPDAMKFYVHCMMQWQADVCPKACSGKKKRHTKRCCCKGSYYHPYKTCLKQERNGDRGRKPEWKVISAKMTMNDWCVATTETAHRLSANACEQKTTSSQKNLNFFTLENTYSRSRFKGISIMRCQKVGETLQWISLDLGGGKTEWNRKCDWLKNINTVITHSS